MSKFDAGTAVEAMEYDFSKYIDGCTGEIPEPSTGQMNDFMVGMRRLFTEYRSLSGGVDDTDKDPKDMDAEELGALMDSMDESMATAKEFNDKTILLTAEFCSNQPSTTELDQLPLRVMRAFSKWLMTEINPKDQDEEETGPTPTPSRPATQDRRRATRGSRKVGR